jgi:hypothetical protein
MHPPSQLQPVRVQFQPGRFKLQLVHIQLQPDRSELQLVRVQVQPARSDLQLVCVQLQLQDECILYRECNLLHIYIYIYGDE